MEVSETAPPLFALPRSLVRPRRGLVPCRVVREGIQLVVVSAPCLVWSEIGCPVWRSCIQGLLSPYFMPRPMPMPMRTIPTGQQRQQQQQQRRRQGVGICGFRLPSSPKPWTTGVTAELVSFKKSSVADDLGPLLGRNTSLTLYCARSILCPSAAVVGLRGTVFGLAICEGGGECGRTGGGWAS